MDLIGYSIHVLRKPTKIQLKNINFDNLPRQSTLWKYFNETFAELLQKDQVLLLKSRKIELKYFTKWVTCTDPEVTHRATDKMAGTRKLNVDALLWLVPGEGSRAVRFAIDIKCGKFKNVDLIWNRPFLGESTLV